MKTKLICFILILIGSMSAYAQNDHSTAIYLTNYTLSTTSDVVGVIKSKGGGIQSISLGGRDAEAFWVGRNNQLLVRKKKLKENSDSFDIIITLSSPSGKFVQPFKIIKDSFIHNKVIAHRGAWKNTGAPENSISSLNQAVRIGCEGSEFDVHMSSDSILVIHHDPSIQGVSIASTNSELLLSMKLTNGEPLPRLEDYLKAGMAQTKTKLILEIKPSELGKESSIALTHKIVALVEKLGSQAWVDYISFDFDACKEVLKLAPYAKVSYLNGDKSPSELSAEKFYGLDYNVSVFKKFPHWISEAHNQNLTVNVWTVNEKSSLEDFLKQNADFITTNEPELLLSMGK